jgi:hypothetical protein
MSKRSTISFGKRFHLFKNKEEAENIYLELEDISECAFELWSLGGDKKQSRAVVKIPVTVWKKMIEDWEEGSEEKKIDKKQLKFD